MTKYLFTLVFLTVQALGHLSGQMVPIQLDRPDQTECPFIVPTKYIQLENGLTFEKESHGSQTFLHPTTLWKYGMNERFEFRLITDFLSSKQGDTLTTGLSPVTLGFKVNICQEKGIIPITSFIGHLTTPNWGSKAFQTTYFAPSFRFLMQHTLSKKFALAYNLGAEWDGEGGEPTFIYTLTSGVALTDRLGGYFEFFGFVPQSSTSNHSLDFGLTCLVSNDFMLDLSSGFGLSANAPDYYVSLGISFRVNTKRK